MKNCNVKHYDLSVDGFDHTLFVVIDSTDNIIGSCMLFHDGLIQDFHVVEKYRSNCLGSGLLEKVEEIANEKGIKIVHGLVQHENKAIQFWEKSGFSPIRVHGGWHISKKMKS